MSTPEWTFPAMSSGCSGVTTIQSSIKASGPNIISPVETQATQGLSMSQGSPGRHAVLETIIQCRKGSPERHRRGPDVFRLLAFDHDACDQLGDLRHLGFLHPVARNLDRADAKAAG